jgi:5-phospho-D-xylono-1,4-lactonase
MTATVMTVLGPAAPHTLGVTDAHSHAWIEPVAGADPAAPRLDDMPLLAARLAAFAAAGGGALIDCQPGDCGRNGNRLAQLSHQTGVQIVACTGFHLRHYYGPVAPLWDMTAEQACDYLETEIRDGLAETRGTDRPVWPGFMKIAAEATLAACPRRLFEAAAQASVRTGYAIEIHTERGADVEAILSFFRGQGVAANRLVFCHIDKRPDFGLHRELVEEGVLLEYDTFFRPKYAPEEHVWP